MRSIRTENSKKKMKKKTPTIGCLAFPTSSGTERAQCNWSPFLKLELLGMNQSSFSCCLQHIVSCLFTVHVLNLYSLKSTGGRTTVLNITCCYEQHALHEACLNV